jgi:hypothetical protein
LLRDPVELLDDEEGVEIRRRAIEAGDADVPWRLLEGRFPEAVRALHYRRLSEALFYRNEHAAAVECARAAFEL